MTLLSKLAKGRSDSFMTPDWPLEKLVDYLTIHSKFMDFQSETIWDPCCGTGNIVRYLKYRLFDAYGSDKTDLDFLTQDNPYEFDCIITNPPYSIKDQFLARCYELGKPFALLMPLTAFEGV